MKELPGVERVVRVSEEYRVLGRHKNDGRSAHFDYQGLRFGQDTLHVFAGLCAVDTPENVESMMRALRNNGQVCTRMGAYKPRTSPYSFQGHGKQCLPYVFELAGKYGIKVIAMEVTHESHVAEISEALDKTGNSTGVILPKDVMARLQLSVGDKFYATLTPEGGIRFRDFPDQLVASVTFDPEKVSPRIVYYGLEGWLDQKRKDREYKSAGPAREVYTGDPWRSARAWANVEVQVPVKKLR